MTIRTLLAVFGVAFLLVACEDPGVADSAPEPTSTASSDSSKTQPQSSGTGGGSTSNPGSASGRQTSALPGSVDPMSILINEIGDRVFYLYDSSELTARAQAVLRRHASFLERFSDITIVIEGHCDERGTREYNLALGERRATAARDFLAALGVSSRRMRVISYGKDRPHLAGTGEGVWGQNRRAVTVIR